MSVTVELWRDPASWNEFVASTPTSHFQQSWEWGELAPYFGGRALRLAALREGAVVGAMHAMTQPLNWRSRTHLYVPRGPAVMEPRVDILSALLDAARRLGEEERSVGIKLEPNAPACDRRWKDALGSVGLRPSYPPSQPRSSWVLDISPDCETLLANMKQKTRYNIGLASRRGVEIEEGSATSLEEFYQLYRQTAARDDFVIHAQPFYARMFSVFSRSGLFCMLVACYAGQPLAAITLVRFGTICWYLHGASSNEHRNLMAPHLLQWEGIRWAKRQGCTHYDFRAVPDVLREDQDMYGVYRFKEGFGGQQRTALHTYAAAYQPGLFGLWQLYTAGRFALTERRRRRQGLPARQFA